MIYSFAMEFLLVSLCNEHRREPMIASLLVLTGEEVSGAIVTHSRLAEPLPYFTWTAVSVPNACAWTLDGTASEVPLYAHIRMSVVSACCAM